MNTVLMILTILVWAIITMKEGVVITQWPYDMKMLSVSISMTAVLTTLVKISRIYFTEVILTKRYNVEINKKYEREERRLYDE